MTMSVTFKKCDTIANVLSTTATGAPLAAKASAKRKAKSGHARPLPIIIDLNQPGRLRVGHVMALLAISHATLYARLKTGAGNVPPPDGHDGKRPFWKTSTIKAFLDQ